MKEKYEGYEGYNNLLALMENRNVTFEQLAAELKVSLCRLRARILCGKGISIIEAILIQESFFPDMSLGYLFYVESEDLSNDD